MWYNSALMGRGTVAATLLIVIAAQFLTGVMFASVCLEPCPDDGEGQTCPPVCSLCSTCTHGQQAIVSSGGSGTSLLTAPHVGLTPSLAGPSKLPADIFHVPLFG